MNYHQPRQIDPTADRPDAGKWRYTNMNDGRVWAEGYCADCPGHDTKEGAYEHQTQYVLDHRLRLDNEYVGGQRRCEAPVLPLLTGVSHDTEPCGEWTSHFAQVDNSSVFTLCDAHRNRETVSLLYGSAGDSYGSW